MYYFLAHNDQNGNIIFNQTNAQPFILKQELISRGIVVKMECI